MKTNIPANQSAHRIRSLAAILILAATAMSATALRAGNLYVPNFSFESVPTESLDIRIDSWQKAPQPPPEEYDTNIFGAWDNLAGLFANTPPTNYDHIVNCDGSQVAYVFNYPQVALFEDNNTTDWTGAPPSHAFNSKFKVGHSYHLTVALTSSINLPVTPGGSLLLSLYYRDSSNNVVTVAATDVVFDTNVFSDLTHMIDFNVDVPTVQTNHAWADKNIGIQILCSTFAPEFIGGVWDVDNVRLTETIAVPNFSFESQPTSSIDVRIDSWQKAPQPPPDQYDTNIFGAWDNLAGLFANTPATNYDHIDNCDGNQVSYVFNYPQMALFQDYDTTDWTGGPPSHAFNVKYEAGKAYRLTVALTSSINLPVTPGGSLLLALYYRDGFSNMVPIAATNVVYDTNVFINLNHMLDFNASIPVVNATDPWAGKNIGIQIYCTAFSPSSIGGVWDVDNVRLTELVATSLVNPVRTNGQFTCALQSEPGLAFEILSSTNAAQSLTNWSSLVTLTNVTGAISFSDTATSSNQRFYRARQLQ